MAIFSKKAALIRLVKKVLNNEATPGEREFVKKYYDYFDRHEIEPSGLSPSEKKALENKILEDIFRKIDGHDQDRVVSFWKTKVFKTAAAAALLIAVGSAFYFHASKEDKNDLSGNNLAYRQADAEPGGNRAVLLLANGHRVVLDSANNGALATQGSSRVLKVGGGQVVYHAGGDNLPDDNGAENKPGEVAYNTLSTPRGGQYRLTLSDGTKVWLNSASSLTFPVAFTGRERPVILKGEAYFEVVKNDLQPFVVRAGNIEIKDIGTHFNVMAYQDERVIQTTLTEGAVKIVKGAGEALLKPGEQAVTNDGADDKIRVSPVDTDAAVAWKNGYFSFYRTSIYQIMRQISRWYDVDVSYSDSLHVFLNGNISRGVRASEVFKMLEMTGELEFSIKGKNVIVKKRRIN